MKNKAQYLVNLLSVEEAKQFSKHLLKLKRKSLLLLFRKLAKSEQPDGTIDKGLLFKAIFGIPHTKQKDYLLRNQLRLLTNELVHFAGLTTLHQKMKAEPDFQYLHYVMWLLKKPSNELGQKESAELIKNYAAINDYRSISDLYKAQIDPFIYQREATVQNYEQLLSLIQQFYKAEMKDYMCRVMEVKMKEAFADRTLHTLNNSYPITDKPIPIPQPAAIIEEDNYLRFIENVCASYRQNGNEKICSLQKALKLCDTISRRGFERNHTRSSLSALIALEYFLAGQYYKAIPFHKKALETTEGLSNQNIITYAFNYLSTMMRIEAYDQAIEIIHQYRPIWEHMPRVKDRFICMQAMYYVFSNNPTSALQCIPQKRKQSGLDHYYYYRFIHLIIQFQFNNLLTAISEVESFIHTIRNNDGNTSYIKLSIHFKKLIELTTGKSALTKKQYCKRNTILLKELEENRGELELADNALLFRWLHTTLKAGVRISSVLFSFALNFVEIKQVLCNQEWELSVIL